MEMLYIILLKTEDVFESRFDNFLARFAQGYCINAQIWEIRSKPKNMTSTKSQQIAELKPICFLFTLNTLKKK